MPSSNSFTKTWSETLKINFNGPDRKLPQIAGTSAGRQTIPHPQNQVVHGDVVYLFLEMETLSCTADVGVSFRQAVRLQTGVVNVGKVEKKLTLGFEEPMGGQDCQQKWTKTHSNQKLNPVTGVQEFANYISYFPCPLDIPFRQLYISGPSCTTQSI